MMSTEISVGNNKGIIRST